MEKPLLLLWQQVLAWYKKSNLTQEQLAQEIGTHQSTVQRLLSKRPKRYTRALLGLCKYARIDVATKERVDPAKNRNLLGALRLVWNGSDSHAKALARVIKSLGELSKSKQ